MVKEIKGKSNRYNRRNSKTSNEKGTKTNIRKEYIKHMLTVRNPEISEWRIGPSD